MFDAKEPTMDIERHILDAVLTVSNPGSPRPRDAASIVSQQRSPLTTHFATSHHNANSSAEDVSTTSESGNERDYQTDFTTPESSESCAEDLQPDDVEDFRDREYPQLVGKIYLDHGGATQYSKSLIMAWANDMCSNLYGNPHSASTPSAIAGHRVDTIRERTLRFFNADPEEFDLVFVANSTAAIKLVGECFKDYAAASNTPVWYGYHRDAHTSLVGVRESTKMHRCFTSDEEVDIWINSGGLGGPRARQLGLFAYPGQSNMTGRRLPLSWPGRIRKSFHKAVTYTLLDAAALASTAPLDLSDPATAPDFVAVSFYKIFGWPDIGALIVRKDSAHVLEKRKYFGGGTVEMVVAINDTWHAKKDTSIHDRLEDGTLPYHSIFALDHAIDIHERLYGPNPMKFISHHTAQLGRRMYDGLSQLKHANGLPVCRIYKDDSAVYGDPSVQGATIAFNVQRADGSLVGFEDVEEAADERRMYIRSGSLCNPGGVATYLDWSPSEMKTAFAAGHRCSNPTQVMLGKATGVCRVSLGAMNTASDVTALLDFITEVYRSDRVDESITTAAGGSLMTSDMACQPGQLPHLSIPQNSGFATTPSTAPSSTGSDKGWEAAGLSLPQVYSTDRSRAPPFIPADYVKLRKPWEEEMRKQTPNYAAMEIKVREMEDASSFSRNPTPSVKARKFGRSVVNLLRTKSHAQQEVRPTPPPPR